MARIPYRGWLRIARRLLELSRPRRTPARNRRLRQFSTGLECLEQRLLLAAWDLVGVRTEPVVTLNDIPVFLTAPAADHDRLFIAELAATDVRIFDKRAGVLRDTPFVTVAAANRFTSEAGLLGLAFDPQYAENGYFYVSFTAADFSVNVWRYRVSADDPNVADPDSGVSIYSFSHTGVSHFGGWIAFGPDGYLYTAIGDGGGGNDFGPGHTPGIGNAQDLTVRLGKILRIDVHGDDFPDDPVRNYAIPTDNPFANRDDAAPEIWAFGLRNPWRNSFDRLTGDFYIADVGQFDREEIDVQPTDSAGGVNYGWRLREGMIANQSQIGGDRPPGAIDPIYNYTHGDGNTQGNSLTGGFVYRGPIDEIQGFYFFADFSHSRIWSLQFDGSNPAAFDGTNYSNFIDWTDTFSTDDNSINLIASFGEDASGNLYILDFQHHKVFQVVTSETRLYRVYNPHAGLHVLTTSRGEFNALVQLGYLDESSGQPGPSMLNFPVSGSTAVHRLYNPVNGQHYLTLRDTEREFLTSHGWNSEGDIGYLYPDELPGTLPIFHLYNVNSGSHLFTVDAHERDVVLANFPGVWVEHSLLGYGFQDEAVFIEGGSTQAAVAAAAMAEEANPPMLVAMTDSDDAAESNVKIPSPLIAGSEVVDDRWKSSTAAESSAVVVDGAARPTAQIAIVHGDDRGELPPALLDAAFALLATDSVADPASRL